VVGHAILSLVLAGLAIAVLSFGIEHPHRAPIFGLLFLGIWAGGAWVAPQGIGLRPAYWFPFLLIAVLLSLVVAVLVGHGRLSRGEEALEIQTGLGLFFWLLVLALVGVIAWAYA
jgi:hypothetical protein